jgi:hypothetical protein
MARARLYGSGESYIFQAQPNILPSSATLTVLTVVDVIYMWRVGLYLKGVVWNVSAVT